MPNYKETDISGSQYQRAKLIQISNEKDKVPFITFVEEKLTILPDKVFHEDVGQINDQFVPGKVINLIDPETDEPLDSAVAYEEIYVILYSLYKQLANARDSAVA